jgi:hypothetical protein
MNIELITLNENEDGSADCELRMDTEGKHFLLELGFNTMLKKAIDTAGEDEFFMKAKAVAQKIDKGEYEAPKRDLFEEIKEGFDHLAESPLSFTKDSEIHEKAYLEGWNDGFELGKKAVRDET